MNTEKIKMEVIQEEIKDEMFGISEKLGDVIDLLKDLNNNITDSNEKLIDISRTLGKINDRFEEDDTLNNIDTSLNNIFDILNEQYGTKWDEQFTNYQPFSQKYKKQNNNDYFNYMNAALHQKTPQDARYDYGKLLNIPNSQQYGFHPQSSIFDNYIYEFTIIDETDKIKFKDFLKPIMIKYQLNLIEKDGELSFEPKKFLDNTKYNWHMPIIFKEFESYNSNLYTNFIAYLRFPQEHGYPPITQLYFPVILIMSTSKSSDGIHYKLALRVSNLKSLISLINVSFKNGNDEVILRTLQELRVIEYRIKNEGSNVIYKYI